MSERASELLRGLQDELDPGGLASMLMHGDDSEAESIYKSALPEIIAVVEAAEAMQQERYEVTADPLYAHDRGPLAALAEKLNGRP